MLKLPSHGRYPYSSIEKRPVYDWPSGKRLAFYIRLNVEHFAFMAGIGNDPFTRTSGSQTQRNFAWRDYGLQVGIWRVFELLDELQMPSTVLLNSLVCEYYRKLKAKIIELAAAITQTAPEHLDIKDGQVINTATGMSVITLADVAKIGYFRQDTLPPDFDVQLSVSHSFVANDQMCYLANGVQGSDVEIDPHSGFVKLLGHWAVDDCGRVINPLLVDEQVRGGIAQGIGGVLYEECMYGSDGYLQNGTLMDYFMPMAADVPDIVVEHIETPEPTTKLGAKGVGEAGLIGAMGAVRVAVNDALVPLNTSITHQPFTPERILDCLNRDWSAQSTPRR